MQHTFIFLCITVEVLRHATLLHFTYAFIFKTITNNIRTYLFSSHQAILNNNEIGRKIVYFTLDIILFYFVLSANTNLYKMNYWTKSYAVTGHMPSKIKACIVDVRKHYGKWFRIYYW